MQALKTAISTHSLTRLLTYTCCSAYWPVDLMKMCCHFMFYPPFRGFDSWKVLLVQALYSDGPLFRLVLPLPTPLNVTQSQTLFKKTSLSTNALLMTFLSLWTAARLNWLSSTTIWTAEMTIWVSPWTCINFLDVVVYKNGDGFGTYLNRKPTDLNTILRGESFHPCPLLKSPNLSVNSTEPGEYAVMTLLTMHKHWTCLTDSSIEVINESGFITTRERYDKTTRRLSTAQWLSQ